MGKIIKNGVPYGGSNNNALNIKYNNANSGLTGTTAQSAIDELANRKSAAVTITEDSTVTELESLDITKFDSQAEYEAASLEENKLYAFPDWEIVGLSHYQNYISDGTLKYTGVSVTIPPNSFFTFTATAVYQTGRGTYIAISRSTETSYDVPYARSESPNDLGPTVTFSDQTASVSGTYYIWAANEGTGSNQIRISGFYITKK